MIVTANYELFPVTTIAEADVEHAALGWLAVLEWRLRDALLPKPVSGEIKVDGGFAY